ncbi:hypothetical protein TNIN_79381 [Trichonephila inaurata madagascariensis]|uniref:Uncharacterized protein n=1 Tax=Trichonephila inaurata madagascariensis TaxID=2747483 RepID=A0A8X6XJ42_9ARAC|nr:hypothetical protein TNIN_79381 [Trichonephila inaurata madagascariensis]
MSCSKMRPLIGSEDAQMEAHVTVTLTSNRRYHTPLHNCPYKRVGLRKLQEAATCQLRLGPSTPRALGQGPNLPGGASKVRSPTG